MSALSDFPVNSNMYGAVSVRSRRTSRHRSTPSSPGMSQSTTAMRGASGASRHARASIPSAATTGS